MLEGYLNQSTETIPDLQQQANAMARAAIDQATTDGTTEKGNDSADKSKSLPDRTKT